MSDVKWITQGCDHDLSVPLFAQDENGWTDRVVARACSKCWVQVWGGETVAWTGSSNEIVRAEVTV
jgi:hypothetical protein